MVLLFVSPLQFLRKYIKSTIAVIRYSPRQASQHMCPNPPLAHSRERQPLHGAPHRPFNSPREVTQNRACTPPCTLPSCAGKALDARSADLRVSFCGRCFKLLPPTSHTTPLAVRDRRLRSFMLCASECGSIYVPSCVFSPFLCALALLVKISRGKAGEWVAVRAMKRAWSWLSITPLFVCHVMLSIRRVLSD